jgi:hypothetical protein
MSRFNAALSFSGSAAIALRRFSFNSLTSTPATIKAAPTSASSGKRSPAMRPKIPAQTGSPV